MGLLDQFSEFAKTPEGQGLLSAAFGGLAGARRGTPLNNIGRGGLAGLSGYGNAIDRQSQQSEAEFQKQFRQMQMDDMAAKAQRQKDEQAWRGLVPAALAQSETTYGAGEEGPTMTPGDPKALERVLFDPRNPNFDALIQQKVMPGKEDYRVVGGDLVKIGPSGVSVAHQSQRAENLPADIQAYNFARENDNYKGSLMDFLRDRVSNKAGATAAFDLVDVTTPDGKTFKVPRSIVATQAGGGSAPRQTTTPRPSGNFSGSGYAGGSAGAAASDQRAILTRELKAAKQRGNPEDVAGLERELARLPGGVPGIQVQSKADEAAAIAKAKAEAEFNDPNAVAKREKKNEGTKAAAQNVLTTITDAKSMVGWDTAGMGATGATSALRRGSKAKDLSTKLETIKANLGFDRLQEMRDQSPTGGALGAIAVQELTALQSTVASLDQEQSPEQLRKSLEKIEGHYNRWMQTLDDSGSPTKSSKGGASSSWEPAGKSSSMSSGGWSATKVK